MELIDGEGFLSQGGKASVERMTRAVYLAETYAANITGLEPQEWLWRRSLANLEQANLKGSLRFVLMEHPASLSQFADRSFDMVLSKETILHVPIEVKQAFFSEIARVLKPGGEIVIMDWMRRRFPYTEQTQKMMDMDGVACTRSRGRFFRERARARAQARPFPILLRLLSPFFINIATIRNNNLVAILMWEELKETGGLGLGLVHEKTYPLNAYLDSA